jgi:hypothetical protein
VWLYFNQNLNSVNVFGINSVDFSSWFSMSVFPRPSIWRIINRKNWTIYCGSWAPIVPNLASDSRPHGQTFLHASVRSSRIWSTFDCVGLGNTNSSQSNEASWTIGNPETGVVVTSRPFVVPCLGPTYRSFNQSITIVFDQQSLGAVWTIFTSGKDSSSGIEFSMCMRTVES